MVSRPQRTIVRFEGVTYEMDVALVRRALVHRQVEGLYHTRGDLAEALGCSRSTASHFIVGRTVSLALTLRALDKLQLTFDDVFTRCSEGEQADSRD
jgi:hypothetical protein